MRTPEHTPIAFEERAHKPAGRASISGKHSEEIYHDLSREFKFYQTSNLKGISSSDFQSIIDSWIGKIDYETEGFSPNELDAQRDLSIKFTWGHDHNFGTFRLKGRRGDLHIRMLRNFLVSFNKSINDFKDKSILDVGCWTGGTTLLLALFAKNVHAIEEVKKYADMASFLVQSFGLEQKVKVEALSLYKCNQDRFHNAYDIVYFPGVIYHLSDPLVALRILYNSLKIGGSIYIESLSINTEQPIWQFWGSHIYDAQMGSKENLDRGGWNWFVPSSSALKKMMIEAGFDDVIITLPDENYRIYGIGKKTASKGICKAGLSIQDIK